MGDKDTANHFLTQGGSPSQTLAPDPVGLDAFSAEASRIRSGLPPLTPGATLGEGGAGIVRLARQHSLGRDVAAKQLKTAHASTAHERRLLQEAWVVGGLEHPNVVPIHDVVVDAEDRLTLVMKRVEGETWARWLADAEGVRRSFGVDDVLDWHLDVLRQVCQALAFAHARGVVHRDIKPDNVMIGRFGEVVIIDWGVAAGIRGQTLAPPAQSDQIAGTPLYMAPRCGRPPHTVDVPSDVYLLGGVLFEILAGQAPHRTGWATPAHGARLAARLPESAPAGLVALVAECMAEDPTDRPLGADQVRQRLDAFRQHRGSEALTDEALAIAHALQDPGDDDVERRFDEARFGLAAALTQWPGNARARRGLNELLLRMAEIRLEGGDPRGAQRLVEELPEGTGEPTRTRVDRAVAAQTRLEAIGRQADPVVGVRPRATMITVLAAIWACIPILGQLLVRPGPPERAFIYGSAAGLFLITAAAVFLLRDSIRRSRISRQLVGWVLLTPRASGHPGDRTRPRRGGSLQHSGSPVLPVGHHVQHVGGRGGSPPGLCGDRLPDGVRRVGAASGLALRRHGLPQHGARRGRAVDLPGRREIGRLGARRPPERGVAIEP